MRGVTAMAGRWRKTAPILVGALALALVAGASAASPDVAAMNLQVADVPGAKIISQHSLKESGYVSAYLREFAFAAPSGSSRLVLLETETALAPSAAFATSDIASAEKAFRSTLGRKLFIASIAKSAKVSTKVIVVGKVHSVAGYDQGFTLPVSLPLKGKRVYEILLFLRLDRAVVFMSGVALRPVGVGATAKYVTALAGHIGTEFTPVATSPPTITGNALQGQTLTATTGTWTAADATFTYQWQRCDAAGANCVPVAGATASTYAVLPTDVGATFNVVVTAANRFGAPSATSAATPVVA
jgi:hypothetical protein